MLLRIDFVFSYWIFTWFLLYLFKLVPYNPLIFLVLGLIDNLGALAMMFYYKNRFIHIGLFVFINFFVKAIPIWYLHNTTIRVEDFVAGIVLFILFNGWLYINNMDYKEIIYHGISAIKNDKPISPFVTYFSKFFE
jgi:hypothetical protein